MTAQETAKKEELKRKFENLVDYFEPDQLEFLYEFINTVMGQSLSKGDLMRIAYPPETSGKIDSALPLNHVSMIKDLNPNFKTHFHAYSYISGQGEISNICEELVLRLNKVLAV